MICVSHNCPFKMSFYRYFSKFNSFKESSLEFPVFLTGFAFGFGLSEIPQKTKDFKGKIPKPVHSMEEEDWIIINSMI